MSLTGQAARDGFKDLVLRVIGRRIQAVAKDYSIDVVTNIRIQEELSRLKREIEELDTY